MRTLLVSGAVTLGLLSSCLGTAQASDDPVPGADVSVQAAVDAAPVAGDSVPAPEDLDEFSEELDDEISLPTPEALEDEQPTTVSETPGDDELVPDEFTAPDPQASALETEASCRARLAVAAAKDSDDLVPCASWDTDTSASGMRPAANAWATPKWCGENGADGRWYVIRFKACGVFPLNLTVINPRTGAVVGRMHYLAVGYAYSKRDSKTWAYQVELLHVSSSGAAKGSSANGKATCEGKCDVAESKFPSQLISASKEPVGQFFVDTTIKTSPKGQKGTGQASAKWRFTNPTWAGPTNYVSLPTPGVRCDNALPGTSKAGCVMPYISEMVYAKNGEFPELAAHIESAQNTKNLPGKHGTKRYLTRLTDKAMRKENRDTACPTSLERPPGKQCDEYPFASTWQGAKTGGGKFSRRMIDGDQNEDGGRALGRFYLYSRIIERDKFLMWIK
ncbi:NucA/NucB deoxyribonuclease domain-containing protein [Streptomyces europaeiscabiei]|uniref:NucA/NucB deoxyribonuclease domain-containing protein n=1 Tax=Streptomyces europaeiscabiei TaxID=146819 RepID=UPI002E2C7245|nr:hypothetical protein [Streptomyces europaeiscabiei]